MNAIKDVHFCYYSEVTLIKCATPGIDSPCCEEVGDISAPVATNKTLFSS